MTAGLGATGFDAKPLSDIVSELETQQRADIDPTLDTSAESVIGNLNAIFATKVRELWEMAQIVYAARSPRNATFATLRELCALTGTTPAAATKGTVTLRATLLHGATLPAGSVAAVSTDATNRWVTTAPVTNNLGSPGSYALTDAPAEAETAGAVQAYAGSITAIATPVVGWAAVTNVVDAEPGRGDETDAALRLRREREVQGAGAGTLGNLRAALSKVTSVAQVVIFENDTDTTDADGIPPHAFEALVLGGTDADVRAAIWAHKPAGIRAYGSTSGTVVDSSGVSRTVAFTRPTTLNAYVGLFLQADPDTHVGDVALKAAIVAFGDTLLAGDPVRCAALIEVVMGLPGVIDVLVLVGLAADAVYPLNLAVTLRQRADLDSARITIVRV